MTPSPEALREARDALQGVQFGELFCTECHSNDEECGCDPDITEQQFEHAAQLVALALDKARAEYAELARGRRWKTGPEHRSINGSLIHMAHNSACEEIARVIEGKIDARHGGGG